MKSLLFFFFAGSILLSLVSLIKHAGYSACRITGEMHKYKRLHRRRGSTFPAAQMKAGSMGIQYRNKHNSKKNNTPKTGVSATEVEIVRLQYITISADKRKTTKYPLNRTQKYLTIKLKTA